KETQDSWTREIDIYIAVSNVSAWRGIAQVLIQALEFLTGDKWRFFFRERPPRFNQIIPKQPKAAPPVASCICLFSGGLDSFIGAIDLLEAGQAPVLVSHGPTSLIIHYQEECLKTL